MFKRKDGQVSTNFSQAAFNTAFHERHVAPRDRALLHVEAFPLGAFAAPLLLVLEFFLRTI